MKKRESVTAPITKADSVGEKPLSWEMATARPSPTTGPTIMPRRPGQVPNVKRRTAVR